MAGVNWRSHEPRHAYSAEFRTKLQQSLTQQSKVPKATRTPTVRDLEWAAGFLEGEGNFRGVDKGEGTARVRCSQCNREPMDRIVALFGGSLTFLKRRSPERQDVWSWQLSGARARGVMLTLYSLMSQKRKEQIAGSLPGKPLRAT